MFCITVFEKEARNRKIHLNGFDSEFCYLKLHKFCNVVIYMDTSQMIYEANQMASFSKNGQKTKSIKVLEEHSIKLYIVILVNH